MGHGSYSVSNSVARNASFDAMTDKLGVAATNAAVFRQRQINNAMNPHGVEVRESRDSAEHPNSLAIVLGLDVTGSMGSVPNFLVTKGLPKIMDRIFQGGEKDPQIMFVAVGDHECDGSPLQIGQFESNDELLDKWLKDTYLEGGGGGNAGESYLLAWYFAGFRTSIDCFEKRGRKGLLFTIGDEPNLSRLPASTLKEICGKGQYEDYTAEKLFQKASETYEVYHVHVKATMAGSRQSTIDGWKQAIGQNLIVVERAEDIAQAIADTVLKHKQGATGVTAESSTDEEIL